ncbi:ankyrin repeat-containing protein [Cryptosporidium canis]|uniref:Ankyrin repeat-containing protein n=1 Tax=Cryptosporidium canis TaxID=195482 RepID=A0A9D5DL22_9CRYT|nr:ankyrin repeat-containing protein [Cryptosporidium canis]
MNYRPSNMMELFGGLPSFCQHYGTQSGNVRYHYSKSGYWEMNSSPSSREAPDESSLGSSVGIGDRKGTVGSEAQGYGRSERESGGHWSLSGSHYRGMGVGAEGDEPVHQDYGDGLGVENIRDGCPIKLSILERLRRIPALPWDKKLTESDIIFAILCFFTMMTLFSIYCNSNMNFYSICNSINKKLIKYSNKFNCEIPLSDAGCNFTMDFGLVFMLNIPIPSKNNLRAGLWNSKHPGESVRVFPVLADLLHYQVLQCVQLHQADFNTAPAGLDCGLPALRGDPVLRPAHQHRSCHIHPARVQNRRGHVRAAELLLQVQQQPAPAGDHDPVRADQHPGKEDREEGDLPPQPPQECVKHTEQRRQGSSVQADPETPGLEEESQPGERVH